MIAFTGSQAQLTTEGCPVPLFFQLGNLFLQYHNIRVGVVVLQPQFVKLGFLLANSAGVGICRSGLAEHGLHVAQL